MNNQLHSPPKRRLLLLKWIGDLGEEVNIHNVDIVFLVDRDLLLGGLVENVALEAVTVEVNEIAFIRNLRR